jgi:hypothetical protein
VVGKGESKSSTPPETSGGVLVAPPPAAPFQLEGLVLLSSDGSAPLQVDGITLTFDDEGVGVIHSPEEQSRLLPWSSLIAHVIEPWSGGITPEWWVDPELNRTGEGVGDDDEIIDPDATDRSRPHTGSGALISLRTMFATYRFLLPGGDADQLRPGVAAFAFGHQGLAGSSSTTTVFAHPSPGEGGRGAAGGTTGLTWVKIRPVLTVLLILVLLTMAILIVLQSAGSIHIPFLGGANSGTVGELRTP